MKEDLTILSPAEDAFAITTSNSAYIRKTRGIYLGVGGNLHVLMASGAEVTFVGLAGGVVHPLQVIRVYATGTSATSIVGIL